MREYTIIRCGDTPDWSKVPALQIDNLMKTEPLPISAQAQVCYNDNALHIRLSAVEEHIRAELTGLLDEICEDSCLEFFFCPMSGDKRYFNIECNPNGCLFLGFGPNVDELVRLIPENPSIVPQVTRTEDGWETVYSIPYSFIRMFFPEFSPAPGYSTRANFYKCGNKTVQPHYLVWNPVPPQRCAFHNPDAFGIVHFA
jgi:hypothetical protein